MFVELKLIKYWLNHLMFRYQFLHLYLVTLDEIIFVHLPALTVHDSKPFCRDRVESASDKTIATFCF